MRRDGEREAIETAARDLASAVMPHDLSVNESWGLLNDPAAAVDIILAGMESLMKA